MRGKRLLFTILPLLFVISVISVPAQPVRAERAGSLDPGDLAIYYGWPSLVNESRGDVTSAAAVFGQYDVVVFNHGLEEPPHGDHSNAKQLIQILRDTYGTEVYGYINGPQWGTIWSTSGMAPVGWEAHVDLWKEMGVAGIFIDEFSYDWNITRTMQNDMLDVVHNRGLRAFVNGWFIDNVFSSQPDPYFPHGNPTSLPSHIGPNDLYLLESFAIMEGDYDLCWREYWDTWITKAQKAQHYRDSIGTTMWAITTADELATEAMFDRTVGVDPRLSFAWHGAAMFGLDGFGWAEPQFSASGDWQNQLPWRQRPTPNEPEGTGSTFLDPVEEAMPLYTRSTDLGQFRVVCDDVADIHTGEFVTWKAPASPNVSIQKLASDVELTWDHVETDDQGEYTPVSHYEVWRHTSPYFVVPDQGELLAQVVDTSFIDPNACLFADNSYYVLRAVGLNGSPSAVSNRVGKFTFSLLSANLSLTR